MQPKPSPKRVRTIYAGGESETPGVDLAEMRCVRDAGDSPERVAVKIRDLSERRERKGLPRIAVGVRVLDRA